MKLIRKRGNGGFLPSLHSNLSELFDMDRFFDEPFMGTPMLNTIRYSRVPGTNIREKDDEYIVEVAAPGMKKKDFHVDIDNGLLEIKVEKEESTKEEEDEFTRREYDYTCFFRSFSVPDSVDAEKIKAEYQDGILLVHLPKVLQAKSKPVKEIAVV